MENEEIARKLDEIADMLEVGGENPFRVRAYRAAARTVRDHSVPIAELTAKELDSLPGIGADLAEKLATLAAGREPPFYRELRRRVPAGLTELLRMPGIGPRRAKLLHEKLDVRNAADLKRALEAGALRTARGLGPKLEARLAQFLAHQERELTGRRRYAEAVVVVEALLAHMKKARTAERIEVAGSFRRRRDTVADLDLLAVSDRPEAVMRALLTFPAVQETLAAGETRTTVVLEGALQVDLRVIPRASYGAALVYFTGSKAHNVHLRRLAQQHGLLLNEYGLYRGKVAIAGATEEEVYRALGLDWIAPELREDRGEIEAAGSGHLPALIKRADLRGDLHAHSTYTDGRAPIEEMARGARERGLQYLAITDHSRRLTMVHGLDPARLREQWREIEKVKARVARIALLRGIEVDILEDGSLDLPDDTLAELDWVVASVHSKFDQSPRDMTGRLIRAIHNRNVDVVGHPSGRLIGRREPSGFDLDEVLKVAREEGCALEVNSQPERLDLTDSACLAAKKAGVSLVISSDAHHPHDLDLLEYGVNQARRGWLEPSDVLNTRPLASLRQRRSR